MVFRISALLVVFAAAGCSGSQCWNREVSDLFRSAETISSYAEDIAADSRGNLIAVGGESPDAMTKRWLVRRKLAAESTWTTVDSGPAGGIIARVVAVDAHDTAWVAGTVTGSWTYTEIHQSTDQGATWNPVPSNLSAFGYAVQALAVDPDGQKLFLAASYIAGSDAQGKPIGQGAVLRSDDAGQTWNLKYDTGSLGCLSASINALELGEAGAVYFAGTCTSDDAHWITWASSDGGDTVSLTDNKEAGAYGWPRAIAIDRATGAVYVAGDNYREGNAVFGLNWTFRKGTPDGSGGLTWESLAQYDFDGSSGLAGDHFLHDVVVDTDGSLLAVGVGEEAKPFPTANTDTPGHWVVARLAKGSAAETWSTADDYLLSSDPPPAGTTKDHSSAAKAITITPSGQRWVAGQARDGSTFLPSFTVRSSCD